MSKIADTPTAPKLETERLELRSFRITDATAIFSSCQNRVLGDNAGRKPHKIFRGFIFGGTLHQATIDPNGEIYDYLCYYLPNK